MSAEEVEERLAHHPSVVDLVVAPAEDARFGQAVGAVAALRPGARVSLGELREFGGIDGLWLGWLWHGESYAVR